MRAALLYGAGDVRVETVPDPIVEQPTDAVLRVVRACVCGSDLHRFHNMPPSERGVQIGHEVLGTVEAVGAAVRGFSIGDLVVASWSVQDNICEFCREGLTTACTHREVLSAGQAELIRIPQAEGSLKSLPIAADPAQLLDYLTLADVYGTGYHAAKRAAVGPGDIVGVIGDGAVGLLAVLSAKQLGAEQIILMGSHGDRTALGREFGATDVIAERGEEGIAKVRALTRSGVQKVLEAVGFRSAYDQAVGIVRPGGVISRVGVPQYEEAPIGRGSLWSSTITLTGGPAPVRAYMDELLPAILNGSVHPGRVFDRTVGLDQVPEAYRAMDSREALKVAIAL